MKALVLEEYGRFVYKDMPDPAIAPDGVLVAVRACGICGSDIHGMDGSTGRRQPPIVMGHEAAGVIAAVGRDAADWHVGDRVTFDSTVYCGACRYCKADRINLCDHRRVIGVSCDEYRYHGAYADYVAIPERALYKLPDDLPFEKAAFVEPVSIAVHAAHRAGVKAGDTAVVIGAGMIGLLLIQVLRYAGCQTIVAVDVADAKLALATTLGATHAVNAESEDAVRAVLDCTGGADCVFEVVGMAATVDTAMRAVRKGGSVTLVGNLSPRIEFPLQAAVTREITLYGSCASSGEYPACLDLIASGAVDVAPLISAVAPLRDGAAWFDRLYGKEAGLMKVILSPEPAALGAVAGA